jgi:hypothetical protein
MKIARLNETTLMTKIEPTHSNPTQYDVSSQYRTDEILAWFCRCKAVSRDLGDCSQVAALFYHLGYGRHQWQFFGQRASNYLNHLLNTSDRPESASESSEGESDTKQTDQVSSDSDS